MCVFVYLYLCIWICVFVFVYLNLWMCMRKRTASFIWKINPILEFFWNCYLIQCMIEILKTFIEKRWTKKHPYLILVASITIFCVKLHSDIDWCCIAARHFLSQNYAVLSVKFASVKNMTNMRYGNIPEQPFRYLDCGGFLLNYHLSSEWISIDHTCERPQRYSKSMKEYPQLLSAPWICNIFFILGYFYR